MVRVTLDLMCYDDLELDDIPWREMLHLEDGEDLHVSIEDFTDIFWLCQFKYWSYSQLVDLIDSQ